VADAGGAFSFPDVVPGAYRLTVVAGTERFTRSVDVAGPVTTVVVTRTSDSGSE
jgi:hypothetical protein